MSSGVGAGAAGAGAGAASAGAGAGAGCAADAAFATGDPQLAQKDCPSGTKFPHDSQYIIYSLLNKRSKKCPNVFLPRFYHKL